MRTEIVILLGTALMLGSCGPSTDDSGPASEQAAEQKKPAEEIRDETYRFHKEGLVEAKVVQDNLCGQDFMPGGNVADYDKGGKKYQVCFTLRRNADAAMFLSMDYRDALSDQKFIPHFGGCYGWSGKPRR
ncbi:MAG: hypothetical protein F4173_09275 [Acidobacteriia bacterium]|nr:hypothetical protein [Terriglobia bacterium]